MESTILRREVVDQLASGEPFDMEFVTCNRKKGTGGDLISVESWMKVQLPATELHAEKHEHIERLTEATKDPHHTEHGTVNIYNPANAKLHPIKVHYDLITFFNGKRVIN